MRSLLATIVLLVLGTISASTIPKQGRYNGDKVGTNACFSYDLNYYAEDINNGLENKKNSPEECQSDCHQNPDCRFFTYVEEDFFDETYHHACWLKNEAVPQQQVRITTTSLIIKLYH